MSLAAKSLTELTDHYNGLPGATPVKKFRDKPTALKRIQEMEPKKKEKTSKGGMKADGTFPPRISFRSINEDTYRLRLRSDLVLKYGRPHDFSGKPMIALKDDIEEALK